MQQQCKRTALKANNISMLLRVYETVCDTQFSPQGFYLLPWAPSASWLQQDIWHTCTVHSSGPNLVECFPQCQ